MGEQSKGGDLLPEGLPEGWKVEIRVRKSGKRDRYYTDPVHGYIFRSIKDIDRYLLTGKFGRHVTKAKPRESSTGTVNVDHDDLSDVSQKKELITSDGTKESCLGLEAQGQKPSEKASKRKASTTTEAHDSKEVSKKKSRKTSTGTASRSSKKKDRTPFYILDSDYCDESDAIDIPNLGEIIDSMRKEKEGHKTVYVSAPAIGSLLGGQTSESRVKPKQDHNIKPHFTLNISHHIGNSPNMTLMPSMMPKHEWESTNIVRPYQNVPPLEKFGKFGNDGRPIGVPGCALFGNLLMDPCIDFAFKTLTETAMPFGGGTVLEDCFSPQQLGSSRMLNQGGPCQT
ncbi:hypothetical protein RND81_12G114400 [Saponaria officinalis]|uniref:MBD domain-containing protein n=1 Tax=Saponaria officinalis TaxID=3572 RepID=A0AAW1H9B2_SAPOF